MKYNIERYINNRKYKPVKGYTDGVIYVIDSKAKTIKGVIRAFAKNTDYIETLTDIDDIELHFYKMICCMDIEIYADKIVMYAW